MKYIGSKITSVLLGVVVLSVLRCGSGATPNNDNAVKTHLFAIIRHPYCHNSTSISTIFVIGNLYVTF